MLQEIRDAINELNYPEPVSVAIRPPVTMSGADFPSLLGIWDTFHYLSGHHTAARKGPGLLTSLLDGHVKTSIITVGMLMDQVKAGEIRPLVFLCDEGIVIIPMYRLQLKQVTPKRVK